jgi:beta-xylosidase
LSQQNKIGDDFVKFKKGQNDEVDVKKQKSIWSATMARSKKGEKAIEFLRKMGLGDGMFLLTGWSSLTANMKPVDVSVLADELKELPEYAEFVRLTEGGVIAGEDASL